MFNRGILPVFYSESITLWEILPTLGWVQTEWAFSNLNFVLPFKTFFLDLVSVYECFAYMSVCVPLKSLVNLLIHASRSLGNMCGNRF